MAVKGSERRDLTEYRHTAKVAFPEGAAEHMAQNEVIWLCGWKRGFSAGPVGPLPP